MRKLAIIVSGILITTGIFVIFCQAERPLHLAQQQLLATNTKKSVSTSTTKDFPQGTGTPSAECGECHQAIYREYAYGFGIDTVAEPPSEEFPSLPGRVLTSGPAHSISGTRPEPTHGFGTQTGHSSCSVCHYPEPFGLANSNQTGIKESRQTPRAKKELGITCASCHLTPDGKIRGPYGAEAPHATIKEPKMQTSDMCAQCHSSSKRVVAKQFQTFLEWNEDFHKPGLGSQTCQDCHMARTLRKTTEDEDVPTRVSARHLWTGGHSPQGISNALSLAIVKENASTSALRFHLTNIGAGHSVPTGSNRRAIYLKTEVIDDKGNFVAKREWMFAPWYGDRPDDKAFLEEDKKRPDGQLAMKADAQGPHETTIRAGEERVLNWDPKLKPGKYKIQAGLIYDLDRYSDPKSEGHQTTIFRNTFPLTVK